MSYLPFAEGSDSMFCIFKVDFTTARKKNPADHPGWRVVLSQVSIYMRITVKQTLQTEHIFYSSNKYFKVDWS